MGIAMKRITALFLLTVIFFSCAGGEYQAFLKRLEADEAYIGFFAAEKECITGQTQGYLEARKRAFLGISTTREGPEAFTEHFIEYCKENDLLKAGCEERWEEVLTILSYELYANMPIFEYDSRNNIAHRDLIFAEYPNKKLALDLFLPKAPLRRPVPCIVCVHGGGWVVNRRIWFEPFARYLADQGFAAVTIDYRKLPAVRIIECVFDTKAAIRWVRTNASKYGIDPDRIGAIGASAGAHLVTLAGTTAEKPELEGDGGNRGVSSALQAVVGIATPAFCSKADARRAERFGLTMEEALMLSPYANITDDSAPLYLIHGTVDETVRPHNSQEMYDRYQKKGAYAEVKWIPGEDHGFYEGTDIAIAMAAKFFKKILIEKRLEPFEPHTKLER